jgi:hypothetical protein
MPGRGHHQAIGTGPPATRGSKDLLERDRSQGRFPGVPGSTARTPHDLCIHPLICTCRLTQGFRQGRDVRAQTGQPEGPMMEKRRDGIGRRDASGRPDVDRLKEPMPAGDLLHGCAHRLQACRRGEERLDFDAQSTSATLNYFHMPLSAPASIANRTLTHANSLIPMWYPTPVSMPGSSFRCQNDLKKAQIDAESVKRHRQLRRSR